MTLVDVVQEHSRRHGQKRAVVFLAPGQAPRVRSYAELDVEARALATLLRRQGHSGRPVILSAPPGVEFVAGFLGCLYAGAIAVPAYPARNERQVQHLRAVCAATGARCILSTSAQLAAHDALVSVGCPELRPLTLDRVDASLATAYGKRRSPTDVAFLQYTSGSTAQPKGVVVTHDNLMANQAMIARAFQHDAALVAAGWLPPYHDMGLIGSILQPLYVGGTAVLMSPSSFIRDPGMWLRAVSEYRATTSGGPNFGYDLCADGLRPEQCGGLDLSHWSVAFTGAEPIRQRTVERFCERFAHVGFSPAAFQPCYGLAEATLLVTSGVVGRAPTVVELDAEPASKASVDAGRSRAAVRRKVVGCGFAPSDGRVVVVDHEAGSPCQDDQPGEVWVSGPHVAQGYWQEPEKSASVFGAALTSFPGERFLRTGDIGFMRDGELFVTGRIKDIVIVRGRNVHAEDIEWSARGAHPALRAGKAAAFSLDDGTSARVVLVHEVDAAAAHVADDVVQQLRARVLQGAGVGVDEVALVRPGAVPMTSSGKVRRKACAERYSAGRLEVVAAWSVPPEAALEVGAAAIGDEESVHEWLATCIASLARASVAAIEPDQTLARLGLDSIAGVRLAHEVRSAFGVELSSRDVSPESTLASVAQEIVRRWERDVRANEPQRAAGERFRASWAQRGVWLADRQAPAAGLYNLSATFDIEGTETSTLRSGFERITARHAVLRSVFRVVDGELWQQILPELPEGWWSCAELPGAAEGELPATVRPRLDAPFDMERGPLVRVHVCRLQTGTHRVALAAHHLVADQWSLALVLDELVAGVSRQAEGPERSHGASPFSEYVAEEWAYLDTPAAQEVLRRWRDAGRGTGRGLTLSTPRPSQDPARSKAGRFRTRLPPQTSARLRAFAAAHDSTPYCVIL
ncbi:MAG TPA: AMP-binding protein, partial [Polyangiaceae bacterium]|nr:AMP-binding protein [Polyangiaceae bacterium]